MQRFNFKHRHETEGWWIGKICCAMLGRLLFEVNELDKWRVMLYIIGPKNTGKTELWKTILQRFFDVANEFNVYTYEREPDKFSVQAMVGKEIAVAPDLKSQVQPPPRWPFPGERAAAQSLSLESVTDSNERDWAAATRKEARRAL